MKEIFLFISLMFCAFNVSAQITISPELAIKLQGKDNFNDVWQTVSDHYQSMNLDSNKVAYREFKKWNRWAWWAVRNIDENGKIINNQNEVARTYNSIAEQKSTDRSNTGGWYSLGTNSYTYLSGNIVGTGRVDRIIFHPINPNILYVASSGGGLWKSTDQGSTWNCLTNSLPNCGVTGVALDESDPSGNTIFIATGDGDSSDGGFVNSYQFRKSSYGILKTTNGGITWKVLGNSQTQMGSRRPYKLIQVKGFPNRLICATTSGILLSTDGGLTWNISPATTGSSFYDIEQDPDNNDIIFVCRSSGIAKSTDGGLTFASMSNSDFTPQAGSCARSALSFNKSNSDELYFLQLGADVTTDRLYKSTDSGVTFNSICYANIANEGEAYMAGFEAKGSDVLVGCVNLFKSTNGGTSFPNSGTNWFANSTTNPLFIHADIHDLAFNPLNGKLYGATDGGVFVSDNNGSTWAHVSNGLNTLQSYHMDGLDAAPNTFASGFQDNGSALTTNSASVLNFFGLGDGYMPKFIPTASNIIYYVYNQNVAKYNISTGSNVDVTPSLGWFPKLACHPNNNQIAYFGFGSNIYKTSNQGSTIVSITNFGASNNSNTHAGGLATSNAAPDYLYAADDLNVRKSTDQGATWTQINTNPGWSNNYTAITDISACNGNQDILYVATNSSTNAKVLFTQDGGDSWINITGTLPSEAIVFSVVSHDNGDAYIGTNMGVFYQGITMTDWVPYMNGLPLVEVTDLFINEADFTITASTFGRGFFQSSLYTTCQPYEYLTGAILGKRRYQSSGTIESVHAMGGSYGNNLAYRADTKIRLLPGFKIQEGAYFHGQIQPCGQGIFNATSKKPLPSSSK
jgi:photosystem II stability/assembly factor-like uncharacterized protein